MRPWTRRERERAARVLMSRAFMEIRYLAATAKDKDDPTPDLERIRLLADTCHNLPGAVHGLPPRPGDPDPFLGPWKSPSEHAWMAHNLKPAGLDTAWLDAAPLAPAYIDPVERPRLKWHGVRFPRGVREYAAVDTDTLRALRVDAVEHGAWTSPAINSDFAHAFPGGRHLLRPVRPNETRHTPVREKLAEYRCLVQMTDGAVVADRLELRPAAVDTRPPGLSLARRVWLSASVPQRHERDMYLWNRAHRADSPDCDVLFARRMGPPPEGSCQGHGTTPVAS